MSAKSPHVEIYWERHLDKEWTTTVSGGYVYKWRWRFRSSNGKVISQSSESYQDPRDLVRGLELSFPGHEMVDAEGGRTGIGGWYLWPIDGFPNAIRVRVPDGTVKLWRSRRKR